LLIEKNIALYKKYEVLVNSEDVQSKNMFLIGRLAEYKYFNMDQVFDRAIKLAKDVLVGWK